MIIKSLFNLNFLRRFTRYTVIGLLNNLVGYLIYLLITWLWLEPKLAVLLMYPVGAFSAYFAHAKYSFQNSEISKSSAARYIISQLIGCAVNIAILHVLTDQLNYPHQLSQAVAILAVAGILYFLMRYFVFSKKSYLF
jgi:putative flippase GtrA